MSKKKFPSINKLMNYIDKFYKFDKGYTERIKNQYKMISEKFDSPMDFIKSMDDIKITKKSKADVQNDIYIGMFLTFQCRAFNLEFLSNRNLVNTKTKIMEYEIVDKRFISICEDIFNENKNMKRDFYKNLLKTFGFFKVSYINEIDRQRLYELNDDYFMSDIQRRRQFIIMLDKVLTMYYLKGNSVNIHQQIKKDNDLRTYGTKNKEFIKVIQRYINEKYTSKNYSGDSELSRIKLFLKWIHSEYKIVDNFDDINTNMITSYYEYVKTTDITNDSKFRKCNTVLKFFRWIDNRGDGLVFVDINKVRHKCKSYNNDQMDNPKMFISREHFNQVLEKVQTFKPNTEEENLIRNYVLVLMGAGLRISEGLWLDNNCIQKREYTDDENKYEVGQIYLQVKDKVKVINKRTGIAPWGLKALDELIERFNNRENILLYNEELDKYMYSLFEYKGKLLLKSKVNKFISKDIFEKIEFRDENDRIMEYKNIKSHAFRHQKFNDIYEVSGGNIIRVKEDSNHRSISMAMKYTKQAQKRQIKKIANSIENGTIVGKGAEILKKLLDIGMLPEEYITQVNKLVLSNMNSVNGIVENLKFLGFGFCSGKCKWSHICEECNYFITDEEYLSELQLRYSINYIITMELINEKGIENKVVRKNLVSLRQQERILEKLGMNYNDIKNLRTRRENMYGSK